MDIKSRILELKREKQAIIMAHYYQNAEVQDIADFVGDSFELSRKAKDTDAKVIVFCGVRFMAESAKILNPLKTVLLPAHDAGCPMADMIDGEKVQKLKQKHPDAAFVCYVNTSAEVKAECDVCCTSSNAAAICASLAEDKIVFLPDENLGGYVAGQVDKEFILYSGYCITHARVSADELIKAKAAAPSALALIHPECGEEVVKMADYVGSTAQIIQYAKDSPCDTFIIGTEQGILYPLQNTCPEKRFFMLSPKLICPNMKKTKLADVLNALENNELENNVLEIKLDSSTISRAQKSLDRMLEMVAAQKD